jgi:hypothetical protein
MRNGNNILRISLLPLIILTFLILSDPENIKNDQGKSEKNEKDQNGKVKDKNQNGKYGGNDKNQNKDDRDNKNDMDNKQYNTSKGNTGKNKDKSDNAIWELKKGKGNSRVMNGKRDIDIDWNINNWAERKHPKNQKKVSICHNPSGNDSGNSVTINISENAVQSHLNHGDVMGDCSNNYSDRWSREYIQSREIVYNNYEQTYETMSYSEALLKYAMEKLLGIETNLNSTRVNLNAQEVERREGLILDLQNNVTDLENQLDLTRNKLDSDVNIIVQL